MDENLHNTDDVFKNAYDKYEDDPSNSVWEKLQAGLDKKDAEKYKRKFIGWQRIAIVLLFLQAGFLIYETGFNTKRNAPDAGMVKNSINTPADNFQSPENKKDAINGDSNQTIQNDKSPLNKKSAQPITENKDVKEIAETQVRKNTLAVNNNDAAVAQSSNGDAKPKPSVNFKKSEGVKKQATILAHEKISVVNSPKNNEKNIAPNNNSTIKANEAISKNDVAITPGEKNAITVIEPVKTPLLKITSSLMSDSLLEKSIVVSTKKKDSRNFKPYWSLTGFGSNDWGQYLLDNDLPDNNNNHDEKEEISKREKHESSFSAGVMITRQVKKHWGVKTGIIFSNTAIVIAPQEIYAAKEANGTIAYKYNVSSGYGYVKPGFGLPPAVGDSLQSATAQHNLQAVSVPLMINYKWDKKKLSIIPSAGLTANLITKATVRTEVKDAVNKETVNINGLNGTKNFYLGFVADVNLQYNANSRWAVNVLPTLKYALTPITKNNVVKTFPYSFAIGAGLTYKL